MTRPTPEWVAQAALLPIGGVMSVTTTCTVQAVRYQLNKLGNYKTKSKPFGFNIERRG